MVVFLSQYLVLDRTAMYATMEAHSIPVLPHYIVDHLNAKPGEFEEFEDYILINGAKLSKPFVEKPVCVA